MIFNSKLAIVCNHTLVDLQELFRVKSQLKNEGMCCNTLFMTNFFAPASLNVSRVPSAFSKKPFYDFFMILDLMYTPILLSYLLFKRVKYIHFTTVHSSNLLLAILARVFGIRLIFTIHRFDLSSYDSFRRILLGLYNRLIIKLAYKVVTLSSTLKVPSNKLKVIPLAGFSQHVTNSKNKGKYYLFFGRIDDYKGLDNICIIAKALPNVEFVVAGSGKSKHLSKLIALSNVRIMNRFIEPDEVLGLFKHAKACLLPYKSATQSGVQILSYSYATPVIANNVGNIKEFVRVGKTGFLVENNIQFIESIELMDKIDIQAMSNYCIEYFEKKFSDKILKKQYKEFYSSLLDIK
jgi:glycosyltransferase involved in cell wall biosynthesis